MAAPKASISPYLFDCVGFIGILATGREEGFAATGGRVSRLVARLSQNLGRPAITKLSLWREPVDLPGTICFPHVTKPIVQTICTALPKLDHCRFDPVAAPMRRQRNRTFAKALGHFCQASIENAAAIDYLALPRHPCPKLAADRARMKVALGFFARSFLGRSADADLSIQLDPIKCQRSVRVFIQLPAFLAFIVREKNETFLVESF